MLFREVLRGPTWLGVAGVLTLVFLAVVTVIAVPVVVGAPHISGWTIAVIIASFFLVLLAGLIGLTRRIRVSVGGVHIDAHLAGFRVMHIPMSDVRHTEVREATSRQAGGIGWRIVGTDRFLLWTSGPAVWVTLEGGGRRIIRSDRAQELQSAIAGAVDIRSGASTVVGTTEARLPRHPLGGIPGDTPGGRP